MTKETYLESHDLPYIGKHAKKWYDVWRVLGPAGPEETISVYGLDEAKKAVEGCWDYEITRYDGKVIKL